MADDSPRTSTYSVEDLRRGVRLPTGTAQVLRVCASELRVRLPIDPADAQHWNDRYTLFGKGPNGDTEELRTVVDDQVPGDAAIDLVYPILPGYRYSLQVEFHDTDEPTSFFLFEDVPYAGLV